MEELYSLYLVCSRCADIEEGRGRPETTCSGGDDDHRLECHLKCQLSSRKNAFIIKRSRHSASHLNKFKINRSHHFTSYLNIFFHLLRTGLGLSEPPFPHLVLCGGMLYRSSQRHLNDKEKKATCSVEEEGGGECQNEEM